MEEKPLLLQVAHRVADRRRRDAEPEPPRERPRSGRLGSFDVAADHRFEHAAFAPAELLGCHNFKASNDFGRVSSRRRGRRAAASREGSARPGRRRPSEPTPRRPRLRRGRFPDRSTVRPPMVRSAQVHVFGDSVFVRSAPRLPRSDRCPSASRCIHSAYARDVPSPLGAVELVRRWAEAGVGSAVSSTPSCGATAVPVAPKFETS